METNQKYKDDLAFVSAIPEPVKDHIILTLAAALANASLGDPVGVGLPPPGDPLDQVVFCLAAVAEKNPEFNIKVDHIDRSGFSSQEDFEAEIESRGFSKDASAVLQLDGKVIASA